MALSVTGASDGTAGGFAGPAGRPAAAWSSGPDVSVLHRIVPRRDSAVDVDRALRLLAGLLVRQGSLVPVAGLGDR
jgi:hypothetical protein